MKDELKEENRKAWNYAINLNQLDGEYKPSETLIKLIENEINGEIEVDEIVKILVEKYSQNNVMEIPR